MIRRLLEKKSAEPGIRGPRRGFTSDAGSVGWQGFGRAGRHRCRVEEHSQLRRRAGGFADGRKAGLLQLTQRMHRRQVLHSNAQSGKNTAPSELEDLGDRLGESGFLADEDTDLRSGEDSGGRSLLVGRVFRRLAEPALPTQPPEPTPETFRNRWFSGEEENGPSHAREAPAGTLGAVRCAAESAGAATRDQVCRRRSIPTV